MISNEALATSLGLEIFNKVDGNIKFLIYMFVSLIITLVMVIIEVDKPYKKVIEEKYFE